MVKKDKIIIVDFDNEGKSKENLSRNVSDDSMNSPQNLYNQ